MPEKKAGDGWKTRTAARPTRATRRRGEKVARSGNKAPASRGRAKRTQSRAPWIPENHCPDFGDKLQRLIDVCHIHPGLRKQLELVVEEITDKPEVANKDAQWLSRITAFRRRVDAIFGEDFAKHYVEIAEAVIAAECPKSDASAEEVEVVQLAGRPRKPSNKPRRVRPDGRSRGFGARVA